MSEYILKKKFLEQKDESTERPRRQHHIVVGDFLRLPVFFYNTLGIAPYETDRTPSLWFNLYFVLIMSNATLNGTLEFVYTWMCFRQNDIFEGCIMCGYCAFTVTGMLKIVAVAMQKKRLTTLVKSLESCFPPSDKREQEQYSVKSYLKRCDLFSKGFAGLFLIMYFIHSLTAIIIYAYRILVLRLPDVEESLPFFDLEPWNWQGSWRYYMSYVAQSIGGYTATVGNFAADLMIFGVVFQVTMYFEGLSRALREFRIRNGSEVDGARKDLEELRSLIAYHIKILRLTELMNAVFGATLLLNFMVSSWLVCLLGFQLTIEFSPEHFAKQVLMLVSAQLEIYLLCYFSQMLINAVAYRKKLKQING
nr:odorant receptor 67a-like [Drosophila takahashii]